MDILWAHTGAIGLMENWWETHEKHLVSVQFWVQETIAVPAINYYEA